MHHREGSDELEPEIGTSQHQCQLQKANSAAGPSQGTRSQNSSPTRIQPSTLHFPQPKRLFSNLSSLETKNQDCAGSEYSRSIEDISSIPQMQDSGTIQLEIPQFSALKAKRSSDYHYIANLPWRLAAKTEASKRTTNVKFFSVYIDCNPESESSFWSCDATVEFRLVSRKDDNHFSRNFRNKFNYTSNNWGFPSFIEWSEINNPEKGYIRNNEVLIQAHITVQKVVGVRRSICFDFLKYHPHTCDVTLIIEGKKLHVSKMYLALYSPVFNAMFFSKFSEQEKKEIPLKDVMYEEFVELLNVVYPSHKPVSAENVEFLLELGDKFEIKYVIDECEKFLISCPDEKGGCGINRQVKLVWADQYCLTKLQDAVVQQLTSIADIKEIKSTEEYKTLSDTTKAALLEKVFKLHK